jgi:hypothetical protein
MYSSIAIMTSKGTLPEKRESVYAAGQPEFTGTNTVKFSDSIVFQVIVSPFSSLGR